MACLTPSLQQQSGQHSNPQRNARCSGLTGRAKQQVFRVEGSYTANLWAGMPASTSWAAGWMLVTVGSCSILTFPCLPCGQAYDAQSLPGPDNVGKAHHPTISHPPGQHRVPWQGDRAGSSPTASQQSSPSKSISAHPPPCPCPTCPVLWPKRSSCLIPALNHSFTPCGRKETAHCQISYLKGNLRTFIEASSGSLECPRQSLCRAHVLRHGDRPPGAPGRCKEPLFPQTREPLIQRQAGLQGKARASQSPVLWQSTAKLVAGVLIRAHQSGW